MEAFSYVSRLTVSSKLQVAKTVLSFKLLRDLFLGSGATARQQKSLDFLRLRFSLSSFLLGCVPKAQFEK